ncbi:TetR/AcrR family transcriptional regulator [Acetobacter sp. TBRC 12305]|uniref:TetR/AcrR family transcriptional regulator n=1 Tax=Acetobacter garciniae TaxID=2817435 RepID=A0A939HK87_9PROT|nr:TetR/AcrR family transcriptional regulator [Acetobacter garciniae]MBO1323571.1 TetR/AcrR family transcriptional regulator [Acetobacter garciniae]MBX0343260.1 TetR/AcrR family transcriptional regulator [Acetobacter garciniae]
MTRPDKSARPLDMANPCLHGRKRRCGRPTSHDTEELDQYLLEIAAGLFVQHGYAGTSIDQIARKASASKQTLYRRYPSKEALFVAVIMDLTSSLLQAMADISLKDPLEELRQISFLKLEFSLRPEALGIYRILISDGHRHPSLLRQVVEAIGEPFHNAFIRLLRAAEEQGQIEPGHADDTTARLLTGMITGWPKDNSLFGEETLETCADRVAYFDRAWSFFLRAVGGKPRTADTPPG